MSLYSALTQVLAPFAAKIKGIQTGYDGTEYNSPGEAVREQINDLHVLIGDTPGTAIQASAVAYGNSDVGTELDGVNGRLQRYSDGNVYILSNSQADRYIKENTGALSVYNGWTATDFLSCDGLDKLYVTATALSRNYNAFYSAADESTYISSFRVDVGENVVPVPANAKYYRLSNTTEAMQNEIVYSMQKAELITANEKLGNLFKTARATGSITWEKGYYSDRGLPLGPSFLTCIRSLPSDFIFCGAGSTYQLLSVADGERLRVCRYSAPDESAFIERLTVTNAQLKTIAEDCYIRVYLFYTDNREFAETDWPTLINNFVLNAIQIGYVPQSMAAYLAGKMTEIESKIPALPSDWSDKIQTIQTAQGTKFTFAVQTDTHYYVGYGDNAAYNLKLLTNYVGFDFVANLGDISRGYSDETIDSPANMRAAMTEIMHRYVTDISCPFMYAMGNHEMNSMWVDQYGGEYFSNAELWGRLFRPSFNTNPKAVTLTGKMYYYTDFNDIRVIVLNTQDGANQNFGIGAEQLAWFRTTALNTDKWVLVMSHVPLINGWSVSSNYVSSYADIVDALIAYKANDGKVIGCFAGHTHTKESQTVDGILHVTFRNGGNYAEAVMVDLENKTIGTVMLGASGDRSFSF